jgi:micrococcal nuclease
MKQLAAFAVLLGVLTGCTRDYARSNNTEENPIKIKGRVVGIVDGDTYDLLTTNKTTYRIRMEGIDCPEKGMPYYYKAKKFLSELCYLEEVTVVVTGKLVEGL